MSLLRYLHNHRISDYYTRSEGAWTLVPTHYTQSAHHTLPLPTISSGPAGVSVFTHLMTGFRRLVFLSFIAPSCCFSSLSLRQTACNMNDTYIHVYKPLDSVVLGINDLLELLYSAWNMFDATTTAAEPIDGSVIPDVCYTELFQRRYLFYGKKSHK